MNLTPFFQGIFQKLYYDPYFAFHSNALKKTVSS